KTGSMKMYPFMTQFTSIIPKIGKQLFSTGYSNIVFKAIGIPNTKHRFSIYFPMIRVVKISGDHISEALPALFHSGIRGLVAWGVIITSISVLCREENIPGMIGPHTGKLNVVPIRRL